MQAITATGPEPAIAAAQRLRLQRIYLGCASYAVSAAVASGAWLLGFIDGARLVHFLIAIAAINGAAITLVLTGRNLRLRDPSMTALLIIASLWPSIYVMYFVNEPMVRAAFLLLATVAMLFGALALNVRQMLQVGGVVLISYLLMLAALAYTAPARFDVRVEAILVFAYTVVLVQIAFLGSFIAGLRESLREKNQSLVTTMRELEELAARDPLTRLPNRRTAMDQLEKERSRLERRQQGDDRLCVALLDVDHFKRVNDRHGHQAGDQVLCRIGSTLGDAIRQEDFVARFGGEEFLLLFPETTLSGARHVAERICRAVAAMPVDDLALVESVTASIGIAEHRPGERIEETLARADAALYRAKHRGRNCFEVEDAKAI